MPTEFDARVEAVLGGGEDNALAEGQMISINKLISDAISIPQGDYIIAISDANRCVLVPTLEASKQGTFEVFKSTLSGFFNPDIHKKTITKSGGPTIVEANTEGYVES